MILHPSFTVNNQGHLAIAGVDATELAREFGTPLYVLDEGSIRSACRVFKKAMETHYGSNFEILYASKALSFLQLYNIMDEEGVGVDVVSCGELYTAARAGFPMDRVTYHGNNKTDTDLKMAMDYRVGTIVADSREELEAIDRIAGLSGCKQRVMLRVTPGIDSHTHKKVITGNIDSKFGTPISTGQALELTRKLIGLPNITFTGIHCHIGSNILEVQPFIDSAAIMAGFLRDIKRELNIEVEQLNLGGGFGVRYIESQPEIDCEQAIGSVASHVKTLLTGYGLKLPTILIEPGRSMVATAGATLYTVGSVKTIPRYKTYVSVDGGMTDNPRYTLYQSPYTVLCANKAGQDPTFKATIAGRCCESGDILQEDVMLPNVERGDIMAVLVTGAFNYSMASNYNRVPRAAVVMIKDGVPRVVVRRESYADLVANDVL